MAYVGLVPSENSSGNSVRRGRITKTGNATVRWMLIESAWSCRLKARKGIKLLQCQAEVDAVTTEISWKAQVRLTVDPTVTPRSDAPVIKTIIFITIYQVNI